MRAYRAKNGQKIMCSDYLFDNSCETLAVIGEDSDYVGEDCGNINTCPTGTFDIG